MKLIDSSINIISQEDSLEGIYKQIERGARICYASESMDKTAKEFVDSLIKRGHLSPLEHGTVYLHFTAPYGETCLFADLQYNLPEVYKYVIGKYSKVVSHPNGIDYYVTTNYRHIIEHNWMDDLRYLCKPTKFHEKRLSAEIILSEGIAREFNRHRTFSVSQQSTRYCNFSKDKFGNEISFIKPYWYNSGESVTKVFESHCKECESEYMCLIKDGLLPQEAREVLPLSTATKVMYTAFESDWKHFFELRCSPAAHPDARKLANEIKDVLESKQTDMEVLYDIESIPIEYRELIPKGKNFMTPILMGYMVSSINKKNVLIEITSSGYRAYDMPDYGITFSSKDDEFSELSELYHGWNYLDRVSEIINDYKNEVHD